MYRYLKFSRCKKKKKNEKFLQCFISRSCYSIENCRLVFPLKTYIFNVFLTTQANNLAKPTLLKLASSLRHKTRGKTC
jgi:hypothetical protein